MTTEIQNITRDWFNDVSRQYNETPEEDRKEFVEKLDVRSSIKIYYSGNNMDLNISVRHWHRHNAYHNEEALEGLYWKEASLQSHPSDWNKYTWSAMYGHRITCSHYENDKSKCLEWGMPLPKSELFDWLTQIHLRELDTVLKTILCNKKPWGTEDETHHQNSFNLQRNSMPFIK